jgi:alpha-galactosidase
VWEGGMEPNPATGRGRNIAGARDASGDPTTNANFPDMKGLVDHIHSLGLKAGLYSSPGPTTCQGLGATWQHEEQDARAYARWGFDYLKYDWCGYSQISPNPTLEDRQKPYKLMGDILKRQERDIIFSICQYGAGNVWEWGKQVGGHLWRMTGDIRDDWPSMTGIGFQQTGREQYAGPGGWNDTDMLVVGMVGWSQGSRPTNLTPNEQLTHMALWALQAAPLLIGADLSRIDEWTTNVLGNREMLAVNQDALGKPAGRKMSDGWVEVWARPLADGTIAAGLFNRGPEDAVVTATWKDLGLTGAQPVRDLWLQKDLGRMNNQISATVPRHGVLFVKIGAAK